MCLFSSFLGIFDANSAKVYSIHRACQLIASNPQLCNRNVSIVSDSRSEIAWANGDGFGNLILVQLVYDIRDFLLKFNAVSIVFRPRGANSAADCLAKMGSSRSGDRLSWSYV